MKLKGIIDYDCTNYKEPVLTLEFPFCDFKCDKLNGCQVCQNNKLILEPDIEVSFSEIWRIYNENPLTKGFCFQGLEPFDSYQIFDLIDTLRYFCDDPIIIYTGYTREELSKPIEILKQYPNIIIKWGRFIMGQNPHYDDILGVNLASDNQYAEKIT
jgi:hypothetical protein